MNPAPTSFPTPRAWLVPLLAALGLALLGFRPDQSLFLAINGFARYLPDTFWSAATVLGDSLVALCLLLPLTRRRPDLVVACLVAAVPATLASHGLKDLLEMPRPSELLGHALHIIGEPRGGHAFPSSHTTSAFVLAGVLAMGLRSAAMAWGAVLVASIAGLSRVAVGAHWPGDILGGMLCGWLSAWVGLRLTGHLGLERYPNIGQGLRVALSLCALALLFADDNGYPLARPFQEVLAVTLLLEAWAPQLLARHPATRH